LEIVEHGFGRAPVFASDALHRHTVGLDEILLEIVFESNTVVTHHKAR